MPSGPSQSICDWPESDTSISVIVSGATIAFMADICPACGHGNRPGKPFCANCGAALQPVCPACGATNEAGSRFCDECGTRPTGASPPAEPVVEGASAPLPFSEERRLVTVLFADVTGSTALGEQLDPEDVRALMARYYQHARRIIEE